MFTQAHHDTVSLTCPRMTRRFGRADDKRGPSAVGRGSWRRGEGSNDPASPQLGGNRATTGISRPAMPPFYFTCSISHGDRPCRPV